MRKPDTHVRSRLYELTELSANNLASEGKEVLFDERWYPQVFPNADPSYYL